MSTLFQAVGLIELACGMYFSICKENKQEAADEFSKAALLLVFALMVTS